VSDKIDLRTELLDTEKLLEQSAVDQYSFIRDAYLMRRQSLVYDGDPPREKFYDEEE
jgi:phospholipid-binding lipoprotein MlaA